VLLRRDSGYRGAGLRRVARGAALRQTAGLQALREELPRGRRRRHSRRRAPRGACGLRPPRRFEHRAPRDP